MYKIRAIFGIIKDGQLHGVEFKEIMNTEYASQLEAIEGAADLVNHGHPGAEATYYPISITIYSIITGKTT